MATVAVALCTLEVTLYINCTTPEFYGESITQRSVTGNVHATWWGIIMETIPVFWVQTRYRN